MQRFETGPSVLRARANPLKLIVIQLERSVKWKRYSRQVCDLALIGREKVFGCALPPIDNEV